MNPDQTDPKGEALSVSLQYLIPKNIIRQKGRSKSV